jgi:hypothetical protein
MSDLKSSKVLTLKSADTNITITYRVTVCTTETSNDGTLPYGVNISSVSVTAFNSGGDDITTSLISSSSTTGNDIIITYKYPDEIGNFKVVVVCTLDNSATLQLDFNNVKAEI